MTFEMKIALNWAFKLKLVDTHIEFKIGGHPTANKIYLSTAVLYRENSYNFNVKLINVLSVKKFCTNLKFGQILELHY